jgi:UPF0042 nucleotide-binding protein
MKLIVMSGVSGAGKSTALNVLEDLDYYCLDNLPVGLLPAFAEQMQSVPSYEIDKIAVGIDARNRPAELDRFSHKVEQLKNNGISCEIVFIDADNNILLKRFSETRRKHPLSFGQMPLIDAINKERELLEPLSSRADLYIDTSRTNLHQLRDIIANRIERKEKNSMSVLFQSFGYKHGVPADADFVFDSRCLPNPHWEPRLRRFTGLDNEVIEFLKDQDKVEELFIQIKDFLHNWIPVFEADNRSYLTIAIGCTGGQHRSVYLADRLGEAFKSQHENVSTRHRDIP